MMDAEKLTEPDETQASRDDTDDPGMKRFNRLRRLGDIRNRSRTRNWLRGSFIALLVALYASPAAAQSAAEMATTFCTSPPYNFGVFIVYVIMGGFSLLIIGTIVAGGGMRSMGWISRSIGQRGGKAIVWGAVAFALVAAALVMAGVAYMTLPAEAPSECVVFFGG